MLLLNHSPKRIRHLPLHPLHRTPSTSRYTALDPLIRAAIHLVSVTRTSPCLPVHPPITSPPTQMPIRETVVNMAEKVSGKDLDGDGDVGMRSCPVSKQTGTSCPALRNPAFTLPVYPPLDPTNTPTQAEHGVLGQLDGEWVNKEGTYGIHTTIMPAPGTTSEQMFGAFHFKTDEYACNLRLTLILTLSRPHPLETVTLTSHDACTTLALLRPHTHATPMPHLPPVMPLCPARAAILHLRPPTMRPHLALLSS